MSKCVRFNIIMMKSMLGTLFVWYLWKKKPKVYLYVLAFFMFYIFCYCSIFKTLSRISFPMSLYVPYICMENFNPPNKGT